MLIALRWLASLVTRKRLQPAYAYARRHWGNPLCLAAITTLALAGSLQAQVSDDKLKACAGTLDMLRLPTVVAGGG